MQATEVDTATTPCTVAAEPVQATTLRTRRARAIRIGNSRYPLILPNPRDPRLHVAAVILTIHALGQTVLGFRVSVPQIVAAIGTCFVIEVLWTFSRDRRIAWPASAMLTGSGVALILRLHDTVANDPWSFRGWHVFSLVAAGSLLTKYVIRRRGAHVFNPSNVGLVVAFLVLGLSRAEPLDFWWKPFGKAMILAYLVIIVGGMTIARRARMASMVVAFWSTLAFGLGVLAWSGHMMLSPWTPAPVGGFHYWWVVLTSPETLIFALFMVTDPRTIPSTTRARVLYACGVGAVCSVLMAPQRTEFGTKVALLGGLACCSAVRGIWMLVTDRISGARFGGSTTFKHRRLAFGGLALAAPVILATSVAFAGTNARTMSSSLHGLAEPSAAALAVSRPSASTLPNVQITNGAMTLDPEAVRDKQQLAQTLAWILAVEDRAFATKQVDLLASVDFGRRLHDRRAQLGVASEDGEVFQRSFQFAAMKLIVVRSGPDGTPLLGLHVNADLVEHRRYGTEVQKMDVALDRVYVLRRAGATRWMLVDEVAPPFKMGRFAQ